MTKGTQLPVARLPNQVGANPLSLAHQSPPTGFLAVRVAFMGQPISKLAIAFYKCQPDGKRGDQVSKDGLETNEHGIASVEDPQIVGNYICAIEHQPDALITTVDEIKHPLIVPLPVGRPRREIRAAV